MIYTTVNHHYFVWGLTECTIHIIYRLSWKRKPPSVTEVALYATLLSITTSWLNKKQIIFLDQGPKSKCIIFFLDGLYAAMLVLTNSLIKQGSSRLKLTWLLTNCVFRILVKKKWRKKSLFFKIHYNSANYVYVPDPSLSWVHEYSLYLWEPLLLFTILCHI